MKYPRGRTAEGAASAARFKLTVSKTSMNLGLVSPVGVDDIFVQLFANARAPSPHEI